MGDYRSFNYENTVKKIFICDPITELLVAISECKQELIVKTKFDCLNINQHWKLV